MVEIQFPEWMAKHIDQFTGRAWVLPKILDWWDNDDARVFLLTGDPGTGKSSILGWLSGYGPPPDDPAACAHLARVRQAVRAAHFCQASGLNRTPQAFAKSVAKQLTRTVPGFAEALTATLAELVQISSAQTIGAVASGGTVTGVTIGRLDLGEMSDERSFDRGFTQPLKNLYASDFCEPMLLLVDALDEAQTYTGVTLPDLMSRLADLPRQVRILATTRDEPEVIKFFRNTQSFDLIEDAPPDVDDVRVYAEARLNECVMIKESTRKEFAQRVSLHARGIFLYAALVLDELLKESPSTLPDLTGYPLPQGLAGLYHDFLTRVLGKNLQRWIELYEPMLGILAVAQGEGLTTKQLTTILGKDIRPALVASKQYLSGDLPNGPFRLFHKSFADFLLEEKDNLDFHIEGPTMHRYIAEYYWSTCLQSWSRCDDYGLSNLAVHLFHGQQSERLQQLISQEWMRARVEHDGCRYDGFVADLMLSWQGAYGDALREIEADQAEFFGFATCLRLALIRTSLNSLSNNYSPALVVRALETNVWSGDRALDVAARVTSSEARAAMYLAVLTASNLSLTKGQRDDASRKAVVTARAIDDGKSRVAVLAALVPHLQGEMQSDVVGEVLVTGRVMGGEESCAARLRELAPHFCNNTLSKVVKQLLMAACSTTEGDAYVRSLEVLAPYLEGKQVGEVLRVVHAFEQEWDRARALTVLAPYLRGRHVGNALRMARTVENIGGRVRLLLALVPHLKGQARVTVVGESLKMARAVENMGGRVRLLLALVPYLKGQARATVVGELLKMAVIDAGEDSVARLTALVPHLRGAQMRMALWAVRAIGEEWDRARALTVLAPYLRGRHVGSAMRMAQALKSEEARSEALRGLSSYLCSRTRTKVVNELLVATRAIRPPHERARALSTLAPYLQRGQMGNALKMVWGIDGGEARAVTVTALAPYLRGKQVREALRVARAIKEDKFRAEALTALIPHLQDPVQINLVGEVLRVAQAIEVEYSRACMLTALAPYLRGEQMGEALRVVQATGYRLDQIGSKEAREIALRGLAPYLNGKQVGEALRAVRAINDEEVRVQALTALVPHIRGAAQINLVGEALMGVKAIQDEWRRASRLTTLVPHLRSGQLGEALRMVRTIKSAYYRAWALQALVPHLTGAARTKLVREALIVARAIEEGVDRAQALASLVPYLRGAAQAKLVEEALATAKDWSAKWRRAQALSSLAPYLRGKQVKQALALARGMVDDAAYAWTLKELAPYVKGKQLNEALAAARAIEDGESCARALVALLPLLRDELKREVVEDALRVTQAIDDVWARVAALTSLAPYLQGAAQISLVGEALRATQTIEDEMSRVARLTALMPHLQGKQLTEALVVARAIQNSASRAALLIRFPIGENNVDRVSEIRRCLIDHIEKTLSHGTRVELLDLVFVRVAVEAPICGDETIAALARYTIEIGQWHWL